MFEFKFNEDFFWSIQIKKNNILYVKILLKYSTIILKLYILILQHIIFNLKTMKYSFSELVVR